MLEVAAAVGLLTSKQHERMKVIIVKLWQCKSSTAAALQSVTSTAAEGDKDLIQSNRYRTGLWAATCCEAYLKVRNETGLCCECKN